MKNVSASCTEKNIHLPGESPGDGPKVLFKILQQTAPYLLEKPKVVQRLKQFILLEKSQTLDKAAHSLDEIESLLKANMLPDDPEAITILLTDIQGMLAIKNYYRLNSAQEIDHQLAVQKKLLGTMLEEDINQLCSPKPTSAEKKTR